MKVNSRSGLLSAEVRDAQTTTQERARETLLFLTGDHVHTLKPHPKAGTPNYCRNDFPPHSAAGFNSKQKVIGYPHCVYAPTGIFLTLLKSPVRSFHS